MSNNDGPLECSGLVRASVSWHDLVDPWPWFRGLVDLLFQTEWQAGVKDQSLPAPTRVPHPQAKRVTCEERTAQAVRCRNTSIGGLL